MIALRYLHLFWVFCQKDIAVLGHTFWQIMINYSLIYPATLAFGFGATQLPSLIGTSPTQGTMVLLGNLLIVMVLLSYRQNIELLFDRQHTNVIATQILVAPTWLILLQKLLFAASLSFVLMAPLLPAVKLILGNYFYTAEMDLTQLIVILALGHLFCSSYSLCIACYLEHPWQLTRIWRRTNTILWSVGGLFVPYFAMVQVSQLLGYVVLLNPFVYLTEGLRRAFLPDPRLLPFTLNATALAIFTIIFYVLSIHFFKKREDFI